MTLCRLLDGVYQLVKEMEDLNQKENQPPDLSGRSSSIGKGNVTDSNVILNMNSTKLGGSTSTCVDSEKIASRSTRVSNIGPGPGEFAGNK